MNRVGAETFLRLVAEAEMRGQLAPAPPPWASGPGAGRAKVMAVGLALTAVGALEGGTVESILADLDLAVSMRQIPGPPGQGLSRGVAGTVPPGLLPGVTGVSRGGGPPGRPATVQPSRIAGPAGWPTRFQPAGITGSPEPAEPEPADGGSGSGCG